MGVNPPRPCAGDRAQGLKGLGLARGNSRASYRIPESTTLVSVVDRPACIARAAREAGKPLGERRGMHARAIRPNSTLTCS